MPVKLSAAPVGEGHQASHPGRLGGDPAQDRLGGLRREHRLGALHLVNDGLLHGIECGNYINLEVSLAREQCAYYSGLIRDWTVEKLAY